MSKSRPPAGDGRRERVGAASSAARLARRRLRRRAAALGLLAVALGATIAWPPRPVLLWNASASAPIGLYGVDAGAPVARGDMVIARLPQPARSLAAKRGYLPLRVPLVKRVAALAGDRVCARHSEISINARRAALRRRIDSLGRALPWWWQGCRTLRAGEVLLLTDNPASLDGRYFGPVGRGELVGKARLLWER